MLLNVNVNNMNGLHYIKQSLKNDNFFMKKINLFLSLSHFFIFESFE